MVNWKENVEFIYAMFMLVSLVIAYFNVYPLIGVQIGAGITVVIGVIEGIVGFVLFESGRAQKKWGKMGQK